MMKDRKQQVEVKINQDGKVVVKKFYVSRPTSGDIKLADRYRARVWNECLVDGVLTRQELEQVLKKRGIWSDKQEAEYKKLIKDIKTLEKVLYLGDGKKKAKLSEGKNIAIQIRKKRLELRDLIAEKIALEENTADALADNARFDFLVAASSFNEDGTKVYKDVDDYNSQSADEVANSLAAELASMMYSLDKEFESNLPENKWLIDHKLVNEELSLVNRGGHLVDTEGKLINEEGRYVNEKGELIDEDGNPISERGFYQEVVEYEDDLEPVPTTKPTKRTRKTSPDS